MNHHTPQHNQPSHDGLVSGDNRAQQQIAGTELAHTPPDKFYSAELNNFHRDILGALAERWIRLLEPQLDYCGTRSLSSLIRIWPTRSPAIMPPRIKPAESVDFFLHQVSSPLPRIGSVRHDLQAILKLLH